MLMIGNDLYVFKSQYIGIYDTAAVGAVKRTAVPKQAGESRIFVFAGTHLGISGNSRKRAAGQMNITKAYRQCQVRKSAAGDVRRAAAYVHFYLFRVFAAGHGQRAAVNCEPLYRAARNIGKNLLVFTVVKIKKFHLTAGDVHLSSKAFRLQIDDRTAIDGQRAGVHGQILDLAASDAVGHGQRTGRPLDFLFRFLVITIRAYIDIVDAFSVQIQRKFAGDEWNIVKSFRLRHCDIGKQLERAAVSVCISDRVGIAVKIDRRAVCQCHLRLAACRKYRRLIAVRRKYR